MTSAREKSPSVSQPVRQLVASATDEQLAWMVGPDRDFYSREAVDAATRELQDRRDTATDEPASEFEVAAFALGPVWYFYHGMIGRGVLILLVLVAALVGLLPIAEAAGIPVTLWYVLVLIGVGAYCGRYGARDRAESETQARSAARQALSRPPSTPKTTSDDRIRVAELDCPAAGLQARTLLESEGIETTLVGFDGDSGKNSGRVIVEVPAEHQEVARALLTALLAELRRKGDAICD